MIFLVMSISSVSGTFPVSRLYLNKYTTLFRANLALSICNLLMTNPKPRFRPDKGGGSFLQADPRYLPRRLRSVSMATVNIWIIPNPRT